MTTTKQKPYASLVGKIWIVYDSAGRDVFSSMSECVACAYLRLNWLKLYQNQIATFRR